MRIAQVLSHRGWGDVTPALLQRGCGGREQALLRLSAEWAREGHEVDNFVPLSGGPEEHREPVLSVHGKPVRYGEGVQRFVHVEIADYNLACFRYDLVVSWEDAGVAAWPGVRQCQPLILYGLQCADPPAERGDEIQMFDGIVCLSEWHARYVQLRYPETEGMAFSVVPNGVNVQDGYPSDRKLAEKRRSGMLYYASSPDRGLWHMLDVMPLLQAHDGLGGSRGHLELLVAYGARNWIEGMRYAHYRQGEVALRMEELLGRGDVHDLGLVGVSELERVRDEAAVLTYPCDTMAPTETGCITVMEALASGTPVVTTDCDCLGEEYGPYTRQIKLPFDAEEYTDAVLELLGDGKLYREMAYEGMDFVRRERQWKHLARTWIQSANAASSSVPA